MIALHSLRESQPRHAVSCSALLFLSGQLLTKLCLSSHFLCHYFLQEPKQTCSLTGTHQPLHQKKRHRKKTSQHTRGTGTQNLSFGAKKDNSYPLYLFFSPSTPPSSSFPIPHGQTQRVSSAGILARGSRTLDVPGSQSFRPCSINHLCSGGARRLGGGLKVSHTRACVCPGVGSIAVRLPGASLVQGLIFPHNGSTDWTQETVICCFQRNTLC